MSAISGIPRFRLIPLIVVLTECVLVPSGHIAWTGALLDEEQAWMHAGEVLIKRGEYDEAISYFQARLSHPSIRVLDELMIRHFLGYLFLLADRTEEAKRYSQAAIDRATASGLLKEASSFEAEMAIQVAFDQATKLMISGKFPESNLKFEEALRMARTIASQPYQLKIMGSWSVNYLRSSANHTRYMELNVQSLKLALDLNFGLEACRAANRIGTYYSIKSDFSHALSYYLKALSYVRGQSESSDSIVCLNNIAGVYVSLGDYLKAQEYLFEATERIGKSRRPPFQPSLLINLGQTFAALGRSSQSAEYRERALKCFASYLDMTDEDGGGFLRLQALVGTAALFTEQGRTDEAEALLLPELERPRRPGFSAPLYGDIVSSLGAAALKSGKLAKAEKLYHEALSAATKSDLPLLRIRAYQGLGSCAEARGDFGSAIDCYAASLRIIGDDFSKIVNEANRAEFIGKCRETHEALIELYGRLSRERKQEAFEREIFHISEYLRCRSFLEYQARASRHRDRRPQDPAGFRDATLSAERLDLLKALAKQGLSENERADLKARIRHLDDMLDAARFDGFLHGDSMGSPVSPITVNMLQDDVLSDRTALIEYYLGNGRSFLICITKEDFHLVELPPAQAIKNSVTAFLSFLEDPSMPAMEGLPAAQRLYRSLLAPIDAFMPAGVDHLIIVPDGILFQLPFEALAYQMPGSAAFKYLNERFTFSYSPSASALFHLARKPRASYAKDLLAIGVSKYSRPTGRPRTEETLSPTSVLDDLYGRSGFAMESIPHVQAEISDLTARFKPDRVDAYYGKKASEKAFKGLDLESYRLIHLACHAFSDEAYPLRSALVLSAEAEEADDGYLQVSEMYGMRTNADLAVLSACQTGGGRIIRNEGILGLPRIFFYMGARSVISTLWPINDKASATFMKRFYDSYLKGASKAKALQAAKQKMIKTRFQHPYYWASYVLTGEF